MGKFKLVLMTALMVGLTFALAGMASAAAITCGGCHGTAGTQSALPLNSDSCDGTARGLHGTHANYSSAYYTGKRDVIAPTSYAKCAYCHVNTTVKAPSTTHNNNYTNVTGSDSAGKATNLDYNFGTKTCTNACHKNAGSANPKWGNYTATVAGGIKLDCNSCHDDSVNKFASGPGKHNTHIINNCTTPSGTLMSATLNAGCVNCHPDKRLDLWSNGKASDTGGTVIAYPHATDGTNVVSDKVLLAGQITGATKNTTNTTCTNNCHGRLNVTWGQAMDCNMCHYWESSPLDTSNTGTGAISSGHNIHIKVGNRFACTNCHPDHGSGPAYDGHASRVPAQAYNTVIASAARPTMVYTRATRSCAFGADASGVGCHGRNSTTPDFQTTGNGCTTCHNYPGGGAKDWAANNGHAVKYGAPVVNTHLLANGSYNKTLDNYSTVKTDVTKCGRCHNAPKQTHNNDAVNVVATGAGEACAGGTFTIVVTTSGSNVTCTNVTCHSGRVTPNWW